jgi:hypothetical protein
MKRNLLFLPLLVATTTLLGGCAETVVYRRPGPPPPPLATETVIIRRGPYPPPAPIVEYRPAEPYYRAVWVPGHWQWNGRRYVWRRGHYRAA